MQLSKQKSETETITLSFTLLYKKTLYKYCNWMCDTVHIAVLSRDKQHSASHVVQQQSQSQRPLTTLESAGILKKEIEKGICSRERKNRTKIVFV